MASRSAEEADAEEDDDDGWRRRGGGGGGELVVDPALGPAEGAVRGGARDARAAESRGAASSDATRASDDAREHDGEAARSPLARDDAAVMSARARGGGRRGRTPGGPRHRPGTRR